MLSLAAVGSVAVVMKRNRPFGATSQPELESETTEIPSCCERCGLPRPMTHSFDTVLC